MTFSTVEFVFQFLPLFLVVYYLTPKKYQNGILVVGSFVFYTIGSGWYLLLLLLSVLLNYALSRMISGVHTENDSRTKIFFWIGIGYNVGMLAVFKYTNFLLQNLNQLLSIFSIAIPLTNLEMPLGISFYTFQVISYLADVYTRKNKSANSLLEFSVYVCMFPNLISGPIVSFTKIQPQIQNRRVDAFLLEEGLRTFTLGLGAKTLLADPMTNLWNQIGVVGYDSISTAYAWLGAVAYSFSIYFDFSGYSMMALGVGKMLGFQLPQNFNLPYIAGSMREFWKRWHMTLSRWFRDYVYIPLGGSRQGNRKTCRNLLLVWLLTGLWHGAKWNFVLWGLAFFILLVLERYGYGKALEKTCVLKHVYVICLIPLTWMLFAISDFRQLGIYFSRLFPLFSSATGNSGSDFMAALRDYWKILLLCVLFSTPLPMHYYRKYWKSGFCIVFLLLIGILSVRAMMQQTDNPFLYFQF